MTNMGFIYLGIFVFIVGVAVMILHPYQRGGLHIGGRRGGGAGGPVYFLIFLAAFALIGLGLYLPG